MSIGGISSSDVGSLRDRFQQFQSGQTKLQKEDLVELKDKLASANDPAASGVDSLMKAFDKIDTNSDGMSVEELDAYSKATGSQATAGNSTPAARSITINISPLALGGNEEAGAGRPRGPGGPGGAGGPPPAGGSPPANQDVQEALSAQSEQESSGITTGLLVNIKVQLHNSGQQIPSEASDAATALSNLDTDQDGKISVEELMNALKNQDTAAEGDEKTSDTTDLKALLKKAIAAVGKNQGADSSAASATSAGGSGETVKNNISKYTMTASMTYERQESSLRFQYA